MCSLKLYGLVATALFVTSLYFIRKKFAGKKCNCKGDLIGKTVLITGGNSGIGKATAKILAQKGARIILGCRDVSKSEKVATQLRKDCKNNEITIMHLDLADLQSIKNFAAKFTADVQQLDILINNAAIFYKPFSVTEDGFETVFQTNYLGHFLLTHLLMDLLEKCCPSRVINVSSEAHRFSDTIPMEAIRNPTRDAYSQMLTYGQSKLAMNLFNLELHNRNNGKGVYAVALDPGNVRTNIYRDFPFFNKFALKILLWPLIKLMFKEEHQGAQTVVHAALSKDIETISGKYLSDCKVAKPSAASNDQLTSRALWLSSIDLLNLEDELQM